MDGGPKTEAMANLGEHELIEAGLASLAEIFGFRYKATDAGSGRGAGDQLGARSPRARSLDDGRCSDDPRRVNSKHKTDPTISEDCMPRAIGFKPKPCLPSAADRHLLAEAIQYLA